MGMTEGGAGMTYRRRRKREQGLPRPDKSVLAMANYCFMDMLSMLW